MTKEEFFANIDTVGKLDGRDWHPAENRDAYSQTFYIYTMKPGQRWRDGQYFYGVIDLFTWKYQQLTGQRSATLNERIAIVKEYLHKLETTQLEMYAEFLKKYNNKVEDVIVIPESPHAKEA